MGISLFIERTDKLDRQQIALSEWLDMVAADADLRASNEALRTHNPVSGEVISLPVGPGASQLRVQGEWLPFLEWRRGALSCRYREEMEDPEDPFRRKIAELAQKFDASILLDVQDEPLEW